MKVLRAVWKKWQAFGRAMGDFVGRLVMTLFYFTLAAPFGLAVRSLSDPLHLKPGRPNWEPSQGEEPTLENLRRPY